jgi:hypothetical protein
MGVVRVLCMVSRVLVAVLLVAGKAGAQLDCPKGDQRF